jgi:GR25 family glycosyltransferase involved in LPS biosynthesis
MELTEIWIINLARSKNRWEKISNSLNGYGIKYNRFNAIDGNCLSPPTLNQLSYWLTTSGMRGCYMSHYTLWQQFKQSNSKYFVVLEDDAIIHPNFLNMIQSAIVEMPDFNFISLFNVTPSYFKQQGLNRTFLSLTTTAYLISKQGVNIFCSIIPKEPIYHLNIVINNYMLLNNIPIYELYINPVTTEFNDSVVMNYKNTGLNVWGLKVVAANPAQIAPIYIGDILVYIFIALSFLVSPWIGVIFLIMAIVILVLTHN